MADLNVYSIFDNKSDSFCIPFYEKSHKLAIRSFMTAVADPESKLNIFPDDYSLFYVSTFCMDSGKFEEFDSPELLVTGINALREYRKLTELLTTETN